MAKAAAELNNANSGSKILNFQCFVLCLKNNMPKVAPMPPIKNAVISNIFSLIRCLLFLPSVYPNHKEKK